MIFLGGKKKWWGVIFLKRQMLTSRHVSGGVS